MIEFNNVKQYLTEFGRQVIHQNGAKLGPLLSFTHSHVKSKFFALDRPEGLVQQYLVQPWDEVVAAHLSCIHAEQNGKLKEAFDCQAVLVQAFTKILQSVANDKWPLDIMLPVVVDLRLFAIKLDCKKVKRDQGNGENKPEIVMHGATKQVEYLEKAAELIMGLFRVCASDTRSAIEDSKRWGMMGLCNQLFKIYFKINKLNLCKPMVRAIENMGMLEGFSLAQRITYNYFVARKAIFEDDFKLADEYLTFAFNRCHRASFHNKRLILIYLIPVKMLLGTLPKRFLLDKYRLPQFVGIVEAVRGGRLAALNRELEQHEAFFVNCGIYLLLEKLKMVTYRNLFKRVHRTLGTHLLPMEAFQVALRLMGVEDVDLDEIHCILANLIYEGKIKGYLALQQQKLVVSKQQAFPPISTHNLTHMKT